MSWVRIDDRYHSNRKIMRAWRAHPRAVGLHALAVTYCAMHETDGIVDDEWIEEKVPVARERAAVLAALVETGLFETDEDGAYMVHDYLVYNPTREKAEQEREWDRRRKELHRDPKLIAALRSRDEDRCRYCGTLVNWKDRRGPTGGTYDHVTPRGPNTLENVVVACRRCNNAKGPRTPEVARMPLLTPGQMGSGSDLAPSQIGSDRRPIYPSQPIPSQPVVDVVTPMGSFGENGRTA